MANKTWRTRFDRRRRVPLAAEDQKDQPGREQFVSGELPNWNADDPRNPYTETLPSSITSADLYHSLMITRNAGRRVVFFNIN
jgi:hypothetical protein